MNKVAKYLIWIVGLSAWLIDLHYSGLANEANYIQFISGPGILFGLVEWLEHKARHKEIHRMVKEIHERGRK